MTLRDGRANRPSAVTIDVIRKRPCGGAWAVEVVVADPIAWRRHAAGR